MFWLWLYAMMAILLAVLVSFMAIEKDIIDRRDSKRDAWWPDPKNKDKGKRENERPYIS